MRRITRRLRELHVFSEMLPCTQKLSELKFKPKGIILSGGPYSVYEEGSPHVDPAVFDLSNFVPGPDPLFVADSLLIRCAHSGHLLYVDSPPWDWFQSYGGP